MSNGENAPRFPESFYRGVGRYNRALIAIRNQRTAAALEHGLTLRQYELLCVLRAAASYPQTSIGEIAHTMGVESNTITALIDRLEREGLVERRHAPRGVVYPVLTEQGQQAMDDTLAGLRDHMDLVAMAEMASTTLHGLAVAEGGRTIAEGVVRALRERGVIS